MPQARPELQEAHPEDDLELEREIGTAAFVAKLKEFVLAGKNIRNVGFFLDFTRSKAILARPRPADWSNGKRSPGVRRYSRWTEEELRAAREADAGRQWPDPPDDEPPGAGLLIGGSEYAEWLRAAGGLGGLMASGP